MLSRYRPLSKYIGLYQTYKYNKGTFRRLFPSPLEVDRFISAEELKRQEAFISGFRPLARYIGLYRWFQ